MIDHPSRTIEFSRWLHAATPDQWHQSAQSWNWDNGTYRLKWIVEQPTCDLGTALLIFWGSDPFWNLRQLNPYRDPRERSSAAVDAESINIQIRILNRWLFDDFATSDIAFDGYPIRDDMKMNILPIVPIEVLEEMASPRPGKKIERGQFDEGIPWDIVEAFNKANGIEPV